MTCYTSVESHQTKLQLPGIKELGAENYIDSIERLDRNYLDSSSHIPHFGDDESCFGSITNGTSFNVGETAPRTGRHW